MANAFGTITIVDMTDVGQFSTVPMSNAGTAMIYDPNAISNQYTPASITLSPYTIYGGVDMSSDNSIVYNWYKRTGGSTFDYSNPGVGTTGRTVTIQSSDFNSGATKSISYYLKAEYAVDNNITVVAWGQITINLVVQATDIQDIEIDGNHLFKYKYVTYGGNPIIDGDTYVTLTASCTSNVAVHQWYYWNVNKTPNPGWSELTTAIAKGSGTAGVVSGNICTIDNTANIFSNNKAKIKVTAHRVDNTSVELSSVYDEYEVLKLYDGQIGAPGEGSTVLRLSNEDQMIPCDGSGRPTPSAFDLAYTDIQVVDSDGDATSSWTISCVPTGVVGSYDGNSYRYSVTGWAQDNTSEVAYVTITASKTGQPDLVKLMSLTKIQTGSDGESPTVYNLAITPNTVTTNENNQITTTGGITLTASVVATKDTTQTDVTTSNTDIIYYEWYLNGSNSAAHTGTGSNGYQYSINQGTTVTSVVCRIRKTNSSGTLIDSQSVSFVPKGNPGATGATGDGAITLDFPQNMDTIGLKSDGTLAAQYQISLPYTVYQGSRALTVTASGTGQSYSINGVTSPTLNITWGNPITITIPQGTKLYDSSKTPADSLNGQFIFPITYSGATRTAADGTVTTVSGTVNGVLSWNLDVAPENGSSVSISDTWTRYKQTNSSTQPSGANEITKSDSQTIAAAISAGGLSKPYYVWGRTHITYSDNNTADTYTVNFYPVDPVNGKSVQTSSTITYKTSSSGETIPGDPWYNTISAAISAGGSKPYYLWTRNVTSYTYSGGGSAGSNTTTYSTSYYPVDKYELTLQASSNIFNGSINRITINPIINKNGSAYTPISNELTWSYITNGNMTPITNTSGTIYRIDESNTHSLIVTADAVNGGTSIQCQFVKDGQTIYAYVSLEDYSDEFRCELLSTMGDKITNGQGSGFVKCILYRNGYEIDKITSGPTIASGGERVPGGSSPHAAIITIATEMSANPKPTDLQDISSITYSWSYYTINNDGSTTQIVDSTYNSTGKAIYIDGTMINKKIMINCEVTVTYVTPSNS